jgi:tetratricopeptide (TPR) repeat protein
MSNESKYLLEDNEESRQYIQKILELLESTEQSYIEMAFQLLEGGGLPPTLIEPLAVLAITYQDGKICKKAFKLLRKVVSKNLIAHLKNHFPQSYLIYDLNEGQMKEVLNLLTSHPEIDRNRFANFFLKTTKRGGNFCLEHHTAPIETILRVLTTNYYLSLDYFELEYLPEELGNITDLESISLEGNSIQEIPASMSRLGKLTEIYFDNASMSEKAIGQLEEMFPKIMAHRYHNEVWQLVNQQKFEESWLKIEKTCRLYPDEAIFWDTRSWVLSSLRRYDEALLSLEDALKKSQEINEKATFFINKGSILQRMKRYEEAKTPAQESLNIIKSIPQKQWNESHYFCAGLAYFLLEDYTKSHQSYDKTIQFNHYYSGGVAWYNKACTFAKEGKKLEMLDCLHTALDINRSYWIREAPADCDFEEYWEDEDFKKLVQNEPKEE